MTNKKKLYIDVITIIIIFIKYGWNKTAKSRNMKNYNFSFIPAFFSSFHKPNLASFESTFPCFFRNFDIFQHVHDHSKARQNLKIIPFHHLKPTRYYTKARNISK
jgi:hypothetical protein